MKNHLSRRLESLLGGEAPAFRLPAIVLRQFVGYYGDWRRSRDILNNIGDTTPVRTFPSIITSRDLQPGPSNSYRAQ